MLEELHIRDFAIIDELTLTFGEGMTALTGETGAGKSIIVDALAVALGGRAESTMVRTGANRAVVEATFRLSEPLRGALKPILVAEELWEDEHYLTLGREIRAAGRHTARINGTAVGLSLLRRVGEMLVDIHSQAEHISLLRVGTHRRLLDKFAKLDEDLAAYQATYRRLQAVRKQIAELQASAEASAQRADLLEYQIREIEEAAPRAGEDQALEEERQRLAHAESLAEQAHRALILLDEGTPESPAITDLFGEVSAALQSIAHTDTTQAKFAEEAIALEETLAELAHKLRLYAESLEFDPHRLNEVEERLALLDDLKRKYGGSLESVLEYAAHAREELQTITNAEEHMEALTQEAEQLEKELARQALVLSQKRHAAAERLARAIEAELGDLHMQARFRVHFATAPAPDGLPMPNGERVAYDSFGIERVEFLLAPNVGEDFKPLAKVASGGETARLMLAIKRVLTAEDPTPTLIFDEIDQGIGGRLGAVVGKKLRELAQRHQVLVITHLPQLAAFADAHYHVSKEVREGHTRTTVIPLEGENRVRELAQMLGGNSQSALRSAQELLNLARTYKDTQKEARHGRRKNHH